MTGEARDFLQHHMSDVCDIIGGRLMGNIGATAVALGWSGGVQFIFYFRTVRGHRGVLKTNGNPFKFKKNQVSDKYKSTTPSKNTVLLSLVQCIN